MNLVVAFHFHFQIGDSLFPLKISIHEHFTQIEMNCRPVVVQLSI